MLHFPIGKEKSTSPFLPIQNSEFKILSLSHQSHLSQPSQSSQPSHTSQPPHNRLCVNRQHTIFLTTHLIHYQHYPLSKTFILNLLFIILYSIQYLFFLLIPFNSNILSEILISCIRSKGSILLPSSKTSLGKE